jgi:hypothetical protein
VLVSTWLDVACSCKRQRHCGFSSSAFGPICCRSLRSAASGDGGAAGRARPPEGVASNAPYLDVVTTPSVAKACAKLLLLLPALAELLDVPDWYAAVSADCSFCDVRSHSVRTMASIDLAAIIVLSLSVNVSNSAALMDSEMASEYRSYDAVTSLQNSAPR